MQGVLAFLASGRVFDLVLALLLLETVVVAFAALVLRRAWAARVFGTVLAGLGLAGAARAALAGDAPIAVALCLIFSLAAHGADIVRRLAEGWNRPEK